MSRYEGNNKAHLRPKDYDKYGDVVSDSEDKTARLIDANALKEAIRNRTQNILEIRSDGKCFFTLDEILRLIDNSPTVKFSLLPADESKDDAYMRGYEKGLAVGILKTRSQGEWIDTGSGQECNVCHEIQYGYDNFRHFCANCGAYMQTKENSNG